MLSSTRPINPLFRCLAVFSEVCASDFEGTCWHCLAICVARSCASNFGCFISLSLLGAIFYRVASKSHSGFIVCLTCRPAALYKKHLPDQKAVEDPEWPGAIYALDLKGGADPKFNLEEEEMNKQDIALWHINI